jgi:hypothetical protein
LLATRETDQLKNADKGYVEEGNCHAPSSSPESSRRKSRSTVRMTFSAPQGRTHSDSRRQPCLPIGCQAGSLSTDIGPAVQSAGFRRSGCRDDDPREPASQL